MTPVPKNLSPQQVLAWRRAIRRGASPVVAAHRAAGKYASRQDGGTPATSLSRVARNGVE